MDVSNLDTNRVLDLGLVTILLFAILKSTTTSETECIAIKLVQKLELPLTK